MCLDPAWLDIAYPGTSWPSEGLPAGVLEGARLPLTELCTVEKETEPPRHLTESVRRPPGVPCMVPCMVNPLYGAPLYGVSLYGASYSYVLGARSTPSLLSQHHVPPYQPCLP